MPLAELARRAALLAGHLACIRDTTRLRDARERAKLGRKINSWPVQTRVFKWRSE